MFPYSARMKFGNRIRRLSPALVIALAALFFSLDGTGPAATTTGSTNPVVGVHETHVTQTITVLRGNLGFTVLTCPGKHVFAVNGGYVLNGQVVIWSSQSIGANRWIFGYNNESTTSNSSVTFVIECLKFLH